MDISSENQFVTNNDRVLYIAFIGDLVASRRFPPDLRHQVQERLRVLLDSLNHEFKTALVAGFTITSGDEFEGLLNSRSAAEVLPKIVWHIEEAFLDLTQHTDNDPIKTRMGIGLGTIDTAIEANPNVIDGPAFHTAREAIRLAAKTRSLGGVFAGFGEPHDTILNGLARVLHHQRTRWSPQQHRLAQLLHQGIRKTDAAIKLSLTKQAVTSYAQSAGWQAYVEGESAWGKAIELSLSSVRQNDPQTGAHCV
ncbi:MAG TPA: SatD family protein [Terracidiphilus sp.]